MLVGLVESSPDKGERALGPLEDACVKEYWASDRGALENTEHDLPAPTVQRGRRRSK